MEVRGVGSKGVKIGGDEGHKTGHSARMLAGHLCAGLCQSREVE